MFGVEIDDIYEDSVMLMAYDDYNMYDDDMMLGGRFADSKFAKFIKRGAKKVTNILPKVLDFLDKHKNVIKTVVDTVVPAKYKPALDFGINNLDKLKKPAEMLDKLFNKDKAIKDLITTNNKVQNSGQDQDVKKEVAENVELLTKNVGRMFMSGSDGLTKEELDALQKELKYYPLISSHAVAGIRPGLKTYTIKSPALGALCSWKTKKVSPKLVGRMFMSGSESAGENSGVNSGSESTGALKAKYMVSEIVPSAKKGKTPAVKGVYKAKAFEDFF